MQPLGSGEAIVLADGHRGQKSRPQGESFLTHFRCFGFFGVDFPSVTMGDR
jgi:hypothetical protein